MQRFYPCPRELAPAVPATAGRNGCHCHLQGPGWRLPWSKALAEPRGKGPRRPCMASQCFDLEMRLLSAHGPELLTRPHWPQESRSVILSGAHKVLV